MMVAVACARVEVGNVQSANSNRPFFVNVTPLVTMPADPSRNLGFTP
jgi:hypothetical protein